MSISPANLVMGPLMVLECDTLRAPGRQHPAGDCRVYWGSHGCDHERGHDPSIPHECDCCEWPPGGCEPACVAKPPYYGPEVTNFYGADAEALGLPLAEDR